MHLTVTLLNPADFDWMAFAHAITILIESVTLNVSQGVFNASYTA